jgi:hypothetical protein
MKHKTMAKILTMGLLLGALLALPTQTGLTQSEPGSPPDGLDPLALQLPGSNERAPEQLASPDWLPVQPPAQSGFPAALRGAYLFWGSSPTLVDLDGNGTLEIVAAGRDRQADGRPGCGGLVYAYRHDGSLLWQTQVRAAINSAPTVADLTGDGHPDVVVAMGGLPESQCWHGGVIALNGRTGQQLWTFDTQDWLNHRQDGWRDGVFSTPAIADVNGDGQLEIAFGAWDQCIYLLNHKGQPLWGNKPGILPQTYCGGHGFYNEDTVWSSPALADITGNGRMEIIVGADVSRGNVWGDPSGGYLYVLDAEGNALAREWMDQAIFSSPAVADLDKDGAPEVVVGTGTFASKTGYYVSTFDYNSKAVDPTNRLVLKWRKPTRGRVFASPSIADLNKDGWLDVVISSPVGDNGADGSFVYAWGGRDGTALWERRLCNYMGKTLNTNSSPVLADIDGDHRVEILVSHAWEVAVLNHNGTYYTDYSNPSWPGGVDHPGCRRDHAPTTQQTYWARNSLYATPAVGDLDGDGDAEVVIGGHNPDDPNQGMVFVWTGHSAEGQNSWPTWRHDEWHTGNKLFESIPPTNPTSLSSPSHKPDTPSESNQVQIVWSGAADEGSGVAGYSIVWDTSHNSLPDAIADLDARAEGAKSPPLGNGRNHYFHLRTVDRAGNWTSDAVHLGPFWIDAAIDNQAFLPITCRR